MENVKVQKNYLLYIVLAKLVDATLNLLNKTSDDEKYYGQVLIRKGRIGSNPLDYTID